MSVEAILETIRTRGPALTADDVRDIELRLVELPLEEQHEAGPWVREAIALIVNDPDYAGDAKA